jgi:hypothetical protein
MRCRIATPVNCYHQTGPGWFQPHCGICGAALRSEPMSLVNVELDCAVVTHFQQERLAVVLILYVYALHDFESFQRLFSKGNQNFFSVGHWHSLRWCP